MNRYLTTVLRASLSIMSASLLIGTATLIAHGTGLDPAQACRDCPFPTPMASLHWRLPGGNSDVVLQEINLGSGRVQSVVRLIDARTGELLAMGHLDHLRGRKRLRIEMTDMAGGQMVAELYFAKSNREQVRIKITCQTCNLKSSYLN